MKIIGMMLVRNENWILGLSARAALRWCDEIIVLDHASTDSTPDICWQLMLEYPGRVTLAEWPDETKWDEMDARQHLLEIARTLSPTHLALIDADEVLTGNLLPKIREWVQVLRPTEVLRLPMIPVWRGLDQYRDDKSVWSRGVISLAVADDGKMAWKPALDGYQHHQREPYGANGLHINPLEGNKEDGGVMHLQWASWRRVTAKHALYKMMETVRYPGRMSAEGLNAKYGQALDETDITILPIPAKWWQGYEQWKNLVASDSVPWQEEECKRLWIEHGPDIFKGLDLLGVIDGQASDQRTGRVAGEKYAAI